MLWLLLVGAALATAILFVSPTSPMHQQSREVAPNPQVIVIGGSDRSQAGQDFGDLFGGHAAPQQLPRMETGPGNIPVRHAPRDDTPIYTQGQ